MGAVKTGNSGITGEEEPDFKIPSPWTERGMIGPEAVAQRYQRPLGMP